ncbi:diguanylate cyclase [Martelella endophytica]|nr:diguanylate cyclase [Martelella endophytica]
MAENFTIIVALLEKIGIAALIVLAYRMIRHSRRDLLWTGPAVGIIFAFGAAITMIDPVVISPGVIVDIRTIMVALAALFGGIWAAVIASAATIALRIFIGGAGVVPGVVSILIAAVVSLVYARVTGGRRDLLGLTILGGLISLNFLAILLLPREALVASGFSTMPALFARNLFGTVVLGHLLAMEDSREAEFARFKREAERDPLTGLSNRRVLDMLEHDKSKRVGSYFSIILFDIDQFKRLNDTYGHDFGDRVLAEVAAIIANRMRGGDLVVRYGGEEICVVVAESLARNTIRVAEDIRQQIESADFEVNGRHVTVTVSAGVAESSAGMPSVYNVLRKADEALYEAKGAGRNNVQLYGARDHLPDAGM